MTRWLNEAEMRAWLGYRRMFLLLNAAVNRDLARDSGLSEPDYDVLSNLSSAPDQRGRLNELAARMLWSQSRLSHHISRMEQRGLVRREECESDARGSVVVLTKQGLRTLEKAAPQHVESVRRHIIDVLSPDQIKALGDITETVVSHLGEQAALT
jgi:DNA-binding MarR family transcriptional regulator